MATAISNATQSYQASRAAQRYLRSAPVTNFYPNYGEERAERIAPVQPARFQEIIPRYNLSTSQTRTQGTGPALYDLSIGWSSDRPEAQQRRHADDTRNAYTDKPSVAPRRDGVGGVGAGGVGADSEHPTAETRRRGVNAYRRELLSSGAAAREPLHRGRSDSRATGPEALTGAY